MTSPKIALAQAVIKSSGTHQSLPARSDSVPGESETYEESVGTLAKLMNGKKHSSAKVIQQLLGETRPQRTRWLQELISIREIMEKYPCFKQSKWVCTHVVINGVL